MRRTAVIMRVPATGGVWRGGGVAVTGHGLVAVTGHGLMVGRNGGRRGEVSGARVGTGG